ncbi:MAG: MarR family winged helix-turn-helix transcriptional regulator [Eubacteriales bacterium]
MNETKDIAELSSELTYHRYMLGEGQVQELFKELSLAEYIALKNVSRSITEKSNGSNKTYLKDIAEELRLTVPKTSKMIRSLRDKGLVTWAHDGNGSDGTYIAITDAGMRLMESKEAFLKDYYGRVAEKFGKENLETMLSLMARFEKVMDEELENGGYKSDDI